MPTTMKTASQLIRNFIFSPDQHPGTDSPEFRALCYEANAFLAMEREVQEARAQVKLMRIDTEEVDDKINELLSKYGLTDSTNELMRFASSLHLAYKNLKLESLLKEALELASQSDQEFERENHGPNRVKEIAKEAASL